MSGTWRTAELYWLKLIEPTPEDKRRGEAIWSQCRRCGVRDNVNLPGDLGDIATVLARICDKHRACRQTLIGARWELVVTLANRQRRMEHSS